MFRWLLFNNKETAKQILIIIVFFLMFVGNPVTPYSNEQRSISPLPFSPLTPLIAMKTTNKNISLSEGRCIAVLIQIYIIILYDYK